MHIEKPQRQKERFVLLGFDEAHRFVAEHVVGIGTAFDHGHICHCRIPGPEESWRRRPRKGAATDDMIEAIVFGNVGIVAEVPFAHEGGGIAALF